MSEEFCSYSDVLKNITNSPVHKATLQHRPQKFMFGTRNYGEIIGLRNRADGDRWDIFVPGYDHPLPVSRSYQIKEVMGVLELENKNHKIAVRLYLPGFDQKRADREIQRFSSRYTATTGVDGAYKTLS